MALEVDQQRQHHDELGVAVDGGVEECAIGVGARAGASQGAVKNVECTSKEQRQPSEEGMIEGNQRGRQGRHGKACHSHLVGSDGKQTQAGGETLRGAPHPCLQSRREHQPPRASRFSPAAETHW